MFLGIDYTIWLVILGVCALLLAYRPRKKRGSDINQEQINTYINDMNASLEMRWFKVTAPSEQVPEVLNKIEVEKFTVMYQFFFNDKTGLYDLFFRCRRVELDKIKGIMKDFI
jgi:hypothetical protein